MLPSMQASDHDHRSPNPSGPDIPRRGAGLAALFVRLGAAWLLAGALFKLLAGTPADLPPVVQDLPLERSRQWSCRHLVPGCGPCGRF